LQNYINHIVLVLDASLSMTYQATQLVKVADNQIAYLAERSKELDQETRITVYSFSSGPAKCLVYDKDVLRMPSIASLYKVSGNTALIDATILSIDDLGMTPEKYGEHAFLVYVLTDGQENSSRNRPNVLSAKLSALPDHWTVAVFVPDQMGVFEAKKFGFPVDNIAVWDATTAKGVSEAGETIRRTSDQFMQNRTKGIRGTKSLFKLNTVPVSVITADLDPLPKNSYSLIPVLSDCRIDDMFYSQFGRYDMGAGYYELTKRELIQASKKIAIAVNGNVYTGKHARNLLGLPSDMDVKVTPSDYAQYRIFVQSTSVNRKLIGGTTLLVLR
jgi:hypothetical protein